MTDTALVSRQERADARRAAARSRAQRLGMAILGWLVFLAIWLWGSAQFTGTVMPTPWLVAQEMWSIVASGAFFSNFAWSVLKTALGFVVAALFGAPIGYLMGRSRYWRAVFPGRVTVSRPLPPPS